MLRADAHHHIRWPSISAGNPTILSFDTIDKHEPTTAVDRANRELGTRVDFKGTDTTFELGGFVITQRAQRILVAADAG